MVKTKDNQKQETKKKSKSLMHNDLMEFEKMSWKQIDNLDRKKTVFFLPISPLEEHGPHLPVGTDLLTAKDTAIEAMKIIQQNHDDISCVILPSIPVGYCKFNTDFPGTISVSSRVVKDIVYGYGSSLARHGFSNMIICTYHMAFGHLKGIYAAMEKLRRKYHMNICEPWSPVFHTTNIQDKEPKLGFDTSKDIHAGFRETSLIKYQYPYLLDPNYVSLQSIYRDVNSPKFVGKTFKQIGLTEGYIGSPAKADADYGRWFFNFTVETYVSATEALLDGKTLPDLPKKVRSQMKMLFWE
jgi:creatinine amidohydrolase